jgi:hypothetical protein
MKTLEEDPRLKEARRIPALRRKEKPRPPKTTRPFDYKPLLEHFHHYHYNLLWVGELQAVLALLGENVPYRKKVRSWRTENIHVWVGRCLRHAVQRDIISKEESEKLLTDMEKERKIAITRLEKETRWLPSWRRTTRALEEKIDGQSLW